MATIPCVYTNLPGECNNIASILYEDICSSHASKVFGIGQKNFFLPRSVVRSLGDLTINDSLGILIIAEWNDHQKCDDVVFNENDTVVPFSEYKANALQMCKYNIFGASIKDQFTQRAFAMLLADIRTEIKCASLFTLNSTYRTLMLVSAMETIEKVLKTYASYLFKVEDLVSEKVIYVTKKFQLSKPIVAYYKSLLVPPGSGEYEPMVWNLYGNIAAKTEEYIGNIDLFLQHNATNFISGKFDVPVCRREGNLHCDVLAEKITNIHRETYYQHKKNEKAIRRYARRPLINQYDESVLGTCHNYFLPFFSELFSLRVLSALMILVLPISTKKRPTGSMSLMDYLSFFTDKHIFELGQSHGLGKDDVIAKTFAKAISLLDYQEPPILGATAFSPNELVQLNSAAKSNSADEGDDDNSEGSNEAAKDNSTFGYQRRHKRVRTGTDEMLSRESAFL